MDVRGFQTALLEMDRIRARDLLAEAADQVGRMQAIEGLVVPAMTGMGADWEQGRLALAQVYMGSRILEDAIESVLPPPTQGPLQGPPIGLAVFRDQHQLGKRIVASVLRAGGCRVVDYGQGLEAAELAELARRDRVPLLMVSVLMLHSALRLKELVAAFEGDPQRPILVGGGAPFRFDPTLGAEVGLDAVGTSALDALKLARRFLGEPWPS